jgi:hypothetical protein
MPPKPRQVRIESKSALNAMQQLETRSDEELEKETRFKAAAQAILGTRAAERMDAPKAREHFRAAIAASRPQERLQLRRMAEASLALAERRAGDLKVATEKLGGTPPTNRQLLMLRVMGIIAPPRAVVIDRRRGRDAIEPGPEMVSVPQPRIRPQRAQQRVLQDVLRGVRSEPPRVREQFVAVGLDEGPERWQHAHGTRRPRKT